MINPTVFILSSTFNQCKDTDKLLWSISKQSYTNIKTYIIDDGSTDRTYEFIKSKYKDTVVHKGNGNLWWTGAIYWGVEEIMKIAKTSDYILIVNNDCTFDRNFISFLLKSSLENKQSIMGSLAIDSIDRKTITDGGVAIDWSKGRLIVLGPKFIREISEKIDTVEVDVLSTKGTLYPVEVFRKAGNFDKKHLPHYVSDYEFSIRAKRYGYKLLLSYKARIFNETERTGIGNEMPKEINLAKVLQLLFSRKSRMNIIDHFWFVSLCCPLKYKLQNYLLLFLKPFFMLKVLLLTKMKIK